MSHERNASLAQKGLLLPCDVFAKKSYRSDRRACAQIAERGKPTERMAAEKVAPVLLLEMTPGQRTAGCPAKKSKCGELPVPCAIHIVRRAESACAIVTPSAYSRSPPTGRPRAMRLTVNLYGDSLR